MSPTRRTILRRAASAGVLGLLAGCTEGGLGPGYGVGGDGTETGTPTPTGRPTTSESSTTAADGTAGESAPETTEGQTTTEDTATEMESDATSERTTEETETATDEPADRAVVTLANVGFEPVRRSIDPGTTVRWVNEDGVGHDVTSTQFHVTAENWSLSESLAAGASTAHTFDSPGIYEYYCTIHGRSSMCGVILVGDVSLSKTLPCESGAESSSATGDGDGSDGGDESDDEEDGGDDDGNDHDDSGYDDDGDDDDGDGGDDYPSLWG